MSHVLINTKVRDLEKWKPFFVRNKSMRKKAGSKRARVCQNIDESSDVFILSECDQVENIRKFVSSDGLKRSLSRPESLEKRLFIFSGMFLKKKDLEPEICQGGTI